MRKIKNYFYLPAVIVMTLVSCPVFGMNYIKNLFQKQVMGSFILAAGCHAAPQVPMLKEQMERRPALATTVYWLKIASAINGLRAYASSLRSTVARLNPDSKPISDSSDDARFLRRGKADDAPVTRITKSPAAAVADESPILFYEKYKPFYEFTNLYDIPGGIKIGGSFWPSTEHYFQVQKFYYRPELSDKIRTCRTAKEAFDMAQKQPKEFTRIDWHARLDEPFQGELGTIVEYGKDAVMLRALVEKFTQIPDLKKLLLNTGNRKLVENSGKYDKYWGNGGDGLGKNKLGEILKYVRYVLQNDTIQDLKEQLTDRNY
ncbi:MAG TPA: NADAR family protein [Candidatus Babeliales bacterium]|nr:NADAR family protein [Candidatus Babeliales bacterium]